MEVLEGEVKEMKKGNDIWIRMEINHWSVLGPGLKGEQAAKGDSLLMSFFYTS